MAPVQQAGLGVLGIVDLILKIVQAAIPIVDSLTKRLGPLDAVARQSAVVDLVARSLGPASPGGPADLTLDPRVESATREVIDAVVKLHKHVAAAQIPAGP